MQRAIVLSMFAVLGTAASAVAQDATDAQPDAESAPAAEPLSPPLVPIGAPVVQPETGKRRPAAKPARPKKGRLPRLDPKRNEKEFQRKLALAQDLHVQDRCGAAYPMYLDLQEQRPDHPDVLKGIGLCGIATARFPELGADVRRQRLLDVKAALDTYAARPDATPAEHAIAAYARRQIGEIEQQFAASTPAAPTSAPEVREFPRQKGATTLCGMQAFWDPNQGLNPGFVAELFTLLHADPELRVTIWLPADLNDRVRQLFRTTNDLWLKDQGFCERHGLTSTVLREYASYERRVGFIGAPGAEQQPSRVMLHHPNGIDVAIQRCDAARGALAWAAEEDQRRKQQAISTRIAEGGANREALPAPATVVAATPGAVTPPAPPLVVASPPPPPAAPAPAPVAAEAGTVPPRELSLGHAQQLAQKRDLTGALAELEELLRRHPDDLALQEHWVLWRATSGQCDGVLPVYERLAERSTRPEVHAAGSECADRAKNPRAHLFALERYIRTAKYVGDPEIFFGLANGFATLGDRSRARHYFERYLQLAPPQHDKRPAARAYLAETDRAQRECLIRRGAVTPQLAEVGGRWVVRAQFTTAQLSATCE